MNLGEQHERSVGNEILLPDRFTKPGRPPPHNMYYKLAICIETLRGPEAPRAHIPSGWRVYSGVFLALCGDDGMRNREKGPVTVENYVTGVRAVSLMPPSLFPDSLRGPAHSHQNANLPFKNPPPCAPSQWTFHKEKRQNTRTTWLHRCGASPGARCHSSPMCIQPQLINPQGSKRAGTPPR